MLFNEKKISFEVAGRTVEVSTGKMAKQASGSVVLSCEGTVLLVTATVSKEPRPGIDFFPLMVDFEEKLYAVGRIPGSFNRREGRASDKAVLVSRLIDRPFRPLFPKGYRNDVHISIMTLSVNQEAQPDTLAMLGASFAIELSGAPCDGIIGAIRVGMDEEGKFVANPSEEDTLKSPLDLVVAGTADSVMMVEAGASFIPEDQMVDAIAFAHEEIKKQIPKIAELSKMAGTVKKEFVAPEDNEELTKLVNELALNDLMESMQNATGKEYRNERVDRAKEKVQEAIDKLLEERSEDDALVQYLADNPGAVSNEISLLEKELLRKQIVATKVRADGRKLDEVRPLHVEVGGLPHTHGNGLFTRGSTQVLSVLSLASERSARMLDGLDSEEEKFYMHNYNFPGWSVGEVKPNRGPGRREIGHGALAERAIMPALPDREEFPYAIRVVSEVLESMGSTSMAATCGSTLALMDGGVPLKSPVGGVAMGLIKNDDNYVVLTDIQDIEDFYGDMDFKVTGNKEGISALQMDIKVKGISMDIIRDAINNAKAGRLHILDNMLAVIPEPRTELRPSAPGIITITVDTEDIGKVIGPSGKVIKGIIEETGVEMNIDDDGIVKIYANDGDSGAKAQAMVEAIVKKVEPGEIYDGTVVKILDKVGAIVEILPGQSGLVHISQISNQYVENLNDAVEEGQEVKVKVLEVDKVKGRISLSMKALEEKSEKAENPEEVKA